MDASEIISRWNTLDADRSAVKTYVQDCMQYCLPRRATVTVKRSEGTDYQRELHDSTAQTANERFACGLYNFMWSPARQNFMLVPPIEGGPASSDISRPLQQIAKRMTGHLRQSNFEEAFYEISLDWGAAGLATLEPTRGIESLYEFQAHPFEQIVFTENRRGRVDGVLRRFGWTARQIVAEFGRGEAAVGKAVWDAYSDKSGRGRDRVFDLVHAAMPRTDFTVGRLDAKNMPIASVWVSVADKKILREGGWPQQRYLVSRFSRASGEKFGRGPAASCLPEIKLVNRIERTLIGAAEQVTDPAILDPDNMLIPDADGKIRFYPGSILRCRTNPLAPNKEPHAFDTGARPDFGDQYAESKRDIIKRAFYNDLFLVLGDGKRRTATEVRTLLAEKLALLGPAFGRIKVEMFDPMIRVLLSILAEQPQLLAGIPLGYLQMSRIRYISTLAIAMEYAELSLIEDSLLFLSPLAEVDPTVWDHLSFDEIVRGFLQKMAWPASWLKSRDEVTALRNARMQYQAQQMQAAMAQQQIENVPKLAAPVDPSSVLGRAA